MKAVCVGHSTYDTTLPMDFYPEENLKYRITKNIECGGVLVGYPFKDRESQEIFVVIAGIIPDASSDRSVVHFTVTPDTIARTREILERNK